LDAYELEFHQRVREGYLELVKAEPQRWVIVDASMRWQDVHSALRQAISDRLKSED
jgi:dTMP kinase